MYAGLARGGRAAELAAYLRAAGPGAAEAFSPPEVAHAPGFQKYAALEAGALAHEAGYDAFMTGASFASLAALHRAVAVARGSLPPGAELLEAVAPLLGRINVMRSDMAHVAFGGEDPVLERPHVFHVAPGAGAPGGEVRPADVVRAFSAAGLGRVRVCVLPPPARGGVLAELSDASIAPLVLPALRGSDALRVTPWAEFAKQRTADAAAAAVEAQASRKRRREAPAAAAAPDAVAAAAAAAAATAGKRGCSIM